MKLSLVVPCYNEAENVAPFQQAVMAAFDGCGYDYELVYINDGSKDATLHNLKKLYAVQACPVKVVSQQAVMAAFDGCGYDYELVYINDGSKDATLHNLKKLYAVQACPVKVVSFSRNFGKEAGIYAGLEHADGEYICLIDADLQQRPEIVRDMVKILDEQPQYDVVAAYQDRRSEGKVLSEYICLIDADLQQRPEIVRDMVKILDEQPQYDVVAAYQDRRSEGKVLSFFKRSFYSIINKLSDVTLQPDASDFRTFRRSVRDSILQLGEQLGEYHRFSKGIFAWVGYDTCFIPYTACERAAGTTKWSFWKLMEYAIEGIIGYSTAPLRLATVLGCFSGVGAVLYLIWVLLEKLIKGIDVPGYARCWAASPGWAPCSTSSGFCWKS